MFSLFVFDPFLLIVPALIMAYTTGQMATIPEEGSSRCPEKVKELMKKCWSVDPKSRPSVEEVLDQLS